jgi:hypothetical protein
MSSPRKARERRVAWRSARNFLASEVQLFRGRAARALFG